MSVGNDRFSSWDSRTQSLWWLGPWGKDPSYKFPPTMICQWEMMIGVFNGFADMLLGSKMVGNKSYIGSYCDHIRMSIYWHNIYIYSGNLQIWITYTRTKSCHVSNQDGTSLRTFWGVLFGCLLQHGRSLRRFSPEARLERERWTRKTHGQQT